MNKDKRTTRRLEVVKDKDNFKSRITVTPERVTVKLRKEDLEREDEIVSLALKIAEQIPIEEQSLRGSLSNSDSDRIKMSTGSMGITYLFKRSTGELTRIRQGEGYLRNLEDEQ